MTYEVVCSYGTYSCATISDVLETVENLLRKPELHIEIFGGV
jgi:hypothetical protein